MTIISLPSQLIPFQEAFEYACNRIISTPHDQLSYALYVELIEALHKHPLLNSYLTEIEKQAEVSEHEFILTSLKTFEEEWLFLWRMHPHKWHVKKELVRLKHLITRPGLSFTPLFHQINLHFLHVRTLPAFCPLIKKTNIFFQNFRSQNAALFKMRRAKPNHKNLNGRIKGASREGDSFGTAIIQNSISNSSQSISLRKYFHITDELVLIKRIHLTAKISIPGNDAFEKRKNMRIAAELNPLYCWNRLLFLQKCWHFNETLSVSIPTKGKWDSIKETVWKSAWQAADKAVLLGAKMDLNKSLNPQLGPSPFLNVEHQINRKDYEAFLHALKNHIHTQLLRIQSTSTSEHSVAATPQPES